MKLYVIIGAALAALTLLAAGHVAAWRAGRASAQHTITETLKKENSHAGQMAENWRGNLRRCDDAGGVFDFTTGSCDR